MQPYHNGETRVYLEGCTAVSEALDRIQRPVHICTQPCAKDYVLDHTFRLSSYARLQITVGTTHLIVKWSMDTGDVLATAQEYSHRKLIMSSSISENPGLYLAEICQQIQNSTNVSVSNWLKCNAWNTEVFIMAVVLQYMEDMFVFVHKTGSYWHDHAQKLGHAIREAPVYQQWSKVRGYLL